jgi:hydroxylaminobenzene mutase
LLQAGVRPDRIDLVNNFVERAEMEYRRPLLFHGIALFLIGLFTGLAEQHFTNVRMALAAHLEGVMNGTFLLAVGAIWTEVKLPERASRVAYWALLVGTYGNWAVTTTAAFLGTAALSPIAAAGHSGPQWQEVLVTAGFGLIGLAVISASLLLLWGLRGTAKLAAS